MNKPVLATLGVIGACAACCAIPLAIPLISGLSVAGLLAIDGQGFGAGSQIAAVGAGLATAGLVGAALWRHRRRRAATACAAPATAAANGSGSGCGCASNACKPAS